MTAAPEDDKLTSASPFSLSHYLAISERFEQHYASRDWFHEQMKDFKTNTLESDYVSKKWLYAKVAGIALAITVLGSSAGTAIVQALIGP